MSRAFNYFIESSKNPWRTLMSETVPFSKLELYFSKRVKNLDFLLSFYSLGSKQYLLESCGKLKTFIKSVLKLPFRAPITSTS